ncbi:MAG: amidohydrolase [Prolixibacteraceae bacterium]
MIQEILHVAVYQFDLFWEDPEANRAKIERWLKKTNENIDVIFLPEMFSTGFTMHVETMAEPMNGATIQWLKEKSSEYQVAFCGSIIIRENGEYFNRILFVEPSGAIKVYDKRHLFAIGNEDKHFRRGTERTIINYKGWRICPMICYDLRFPVWARNHNDYDILFYAANWPQNRKEVWNTLLMARAFENQTYVVGANRVGVDGNSISYSGNSQLIDAKGRIISDTEDYYENIVSGKFSYSDLMKFRANFPVLPDADPFVLM